MLKGRKDVFNFNPASSRCTRGKPGNQLVAVFGNAARILHGSQPTPELDPVHRKSAV